MGIDAYPEGSRAFDVKTSDGLALQIRSDGTFEELKTSKENLLIEGARSGIWVRDVVTNEREQICGHVEIRARGVILAGVTETSGLRTVAEIIPEDRAIRIKGYIENLVNRERTVDLQFRMFCDAMGAQWARDTHVSTNITEISSESQSIYPFHGLVLGDRGEFAMAVSPNEPAIFEFGCEESACYILNLKLGLSNFASGRLFKRAHFEVLLYRFQPEWGFRSVTEKYYQLHEKWFRRRAMKNGLWMFYRPNAEDVPNPWDYAYHADIKEGWKEDQLHGVKNLPYYLPGQREFTRLPQLPEHYEEQMQVLEETQQAYTRQLAPNSVYDKAYLDNRLIRSCGVYDDQQKFRAFTRTTGWGGASLTFVLNPDPDLFCDRPDF